MINAILIDDEPINVNNLRALLTKHCPTIFITGTATNANEATNSIRESKPDVVFLDIEMPDKNGFELLKSLPIIDFDVVFVTAYDTYGLMAIKFSALDYLLKPINIDELKKTVEKVEASVRIKTQNARLENLLQLLEVRKPEENQRIALPTQKETFFVPVNEILRCESSNNYTTFFLINGDEHLISKPLYEYEDLLEPYGFIRCHQSHLVNKRHVKSILNEDSGYLILNYSIKKIPIAKQRKGLVKTSLSR